MSENVTDLVDRYIAIWNETDGKKRREIIARTWTDDAHYVDPLMTGDGQNGIHNMIKGVQERFPGHRFSLRGNVDTYGDRVRFSWNLAPDGGPVIAGGTDFAVIVEGKFKTVTGFLDQLPKAAE
jgi:hypothetical protein